MIKLVYLYSAVSLAALVGAIWSAMVEYEGVYGRHMLVLFCGSKLNIVILMNAVYNLMFYLGRMIQLKCYGELTDLELRVVRDRTLNYLLFKVVFMGAILNADVHEVLVWTTWFGCMCFLRTFVLISKQRQTQVFDLDFDGRGLLHILIVTSVILLNFLMGAACWYTFWDVGQSIVLLLLFENIVIFIDALQVLANLWVQVRVSIHTQANNPMESQPSLYDDTHVPAAVLTHYIDFFGDCLTQIVTLAHFIHVWNLYGVSFTLIDLFLFMNMRSVFVNLSKKLSFFLEYRTAMTRINCSFPSASPAELEKKLQMCHMPLTHD
mmetsp:Transcript_5562/g.10233  ORF Transcript_5562/g.10233 Transcript_5562/m.10233 type:complete len:322 (-) Transcript_5562:280-1245(-)